MRKLMVAKHPFFKQWGGWGADGKNDQTKQLGDYYSDVHGIARCMNPNVAKVEGAADPRRQGYSCSNLPQALDNAGDAVPSAFP